MDVALPVRVANRTGDETCTTCGDSGLVIAGTEARDGAEYDVAAPCPLCERGYQVEHALGRSKDGEELRGRAPWGPDGYWRGREIPEGLR